MPRFHVLLASHNRPAGVKRAAFSVLGQSDENWVLHVADDSAGEAREEIEDFFQNLCLRDARVDYARVETPAGLCPPSHKANHFIRGLDFGPHDWLSFLTDDSWYAPDRFENFARAIGREPMVKAFYGNHLVLNRGSKHLPHGTYALWRQARDVMPSELLQHNWIDSSALVHQADVLAPDLPTWSESLDDILNADWRLWHRIVQRTRILPVDHLVSVEEWGGDRLHENTLDQLKVQFGGMPAEKGAV